MKNMKVAKKLIVSFMIVIAMIIAMGVYSAINMMQVDNDYSESYELMAVPMPYMAHILANMQEMRVCAREYALGVATKDSARIEKAYQVVQTNIKANEGFLNKYTETIISQEAKKLFTEAHSLYEKDYLDFMQKTYLLAEEGREQEINDSIVAIMPTMNKIIEDFKACLELKAETGMITSGELTRQTQNMVSIIVAILVAVSAVAIFLAFYVSGLLAKPLTPLSSFLKKAGTTGNLTLQAQDAEMLNKYAQSKDEIGETISSASMFIDYITRTASDLERIAGGDLDFEVNTLSAEDTLGNSLKNMLASLNNMFGNINASMAQVATGSRQIAGGAQSLAQGTTEQAASIEELSSSIAEIADTIKENAAIALKTSSLSNSIKDNAEKGNHQMNEMIAAVGEINEASKNISKIIKTIDDIAFQTNILALNAAVEAARAGQHGKGFAVVAEEVRNLASKSAEAAKDTGDMIQNSMEKAELGSRIAGETAQSLTYIVAGINESSLLIAGIAESSEHQSHGILQINVGIDQVAQVVQQNSATAEESAAASEEISSQSAVLQQLIAQFKLKDDNSAYHSLPSSPNHTQKRLTPPAPEKVEYAQAGAGGSFGKY